MFFQALWWTHYPVHQGRPVCVQLFFSHFPLVTSAPKLGKERHATPQGPRPLFGMRAFFYIQELLFCIAMGGFWGQLLLQVKKSISILYFTHTSPSRAPWFHSSLAPKSQHHLRCRMPCPQKRGTLRSASQLQVSASARWLGDGDRGWRPGGGGLAPGDINPSRHIQVDCCGHKSWF